ncbi:MAG: hypothetical protein ACKOXB_09940 [Flavobacteriales bacterium]
MNKTIKKYPLASLIVTAILCGFLWRVEVEYHGWQGLIWISYFHMAIPVGFTLFLLWTNLLLDMSIKKRMLFIATALLYGIIIFHLLGISLTYMFAGGPSGFLLLMQTPRWLFNSLRYSIFILVPFIPTGAYFIMRIFKKKVAVKFLLLSIFGFVASIPIAIFLLEIINHKGGADPILNFLQKSGL